MLQPWSSWWSSAELVPVYQHLSCIGTDALVQDCAVRTYCWLLFSSLSSMTLWASPAKLFPGQPVLSWSHCQRLFILTHRTWHLPLAEFRKPLLLAFLSNLTLQSCLPQQPTYQFHEKAKVCPDEVQGHYSATHFLYSTQDLNFLCFMVMNSDYPSNTATWSQTARTLLFTSRATRYGLLFWQLLFYRRVTFSTYCDGKRHSSSVLVFSWNSAGILFSS